MCARLLRTTALFSLLLFVAAGCASRQAPPAADRSSEVPSPSLERVAENVWIHQSWARIEPWGLVLSQGLVVRSPEGVILVDTAWTDEETELLLGLIEREAGAPVATVVVTHAHDDKMGGMATVNRRVGRTFALALTNEDAPPRGLVPALGTVGNDAAIGAVEVFYPGPGHTRDNVVVYHPESKILFGGCLIRPGESNTLGNTADADVGRWAATVEAVAARFPEAERVIPSHGAAGGRELLAHTIALARAAQTR